MAKDKKPTPMESDHTTRINVVRHGSQSDFFGQAPTFPVAGIFAKEFHTPVCSCGWEGGALPSASEAQDAADEHEEEHNG